MSNLIKIEEVATLMQSFPEIVNSNSTSVAKCNEHGQTLLDTIEANGRMTEDLDQAIVEYHKKVKVTIEKMNTRRIPITQIFDRIRSFFTSQEKAIDPKDPASIPGRLQKKRDEYATWKHQQEQLRRQEAERTAKIENEKASYRRDLGNKLLAFFNFYLSAEKDRLEQMFNGITIESLDRDMNYIRLASCEYPKSHFEKFTDDTPVYYITLDQKREIRADLLHGKYEELRKQFTFEMGDLKQAYVNRFASKRKELEELEELRKTNAEAALLAEEEKRKREAEETARRVQETKRKEEEQKKGIEADAQVAQMQSLFDQTEATISAPPSNAKIKERIVVLHPAGFIEIFNLWWINEGQTLPVDELEKVFKKQVTFCEKQANGKSPQHIESKYLRYEEEVKAK